MKRAGKMLSIKNATLLFLFAILLISATALVDNPLKITSAQPDFDFSVSLNGYSISLTPNHSGFVQVTVNLVSGTPQNVTLTSSISPEDGQMSTSLVASWGYPSFVTTLIVNALNAQPSKQYQITISGTSQAITRHAPTLTVTITCPQGTCSQPSATLSTAIVGDGSINPSCPSGCSEPVGQAVNVTASSAASWTFSGWNITGASCSNGLNSSPCLFTMPNDSVSITANFSQYQTLYTGYTGDGQVTPECSSGCQVVVGAPVSIVAAPAQGWVVSGYHLTSGVACGVEEGYVCSFTMPNFPISFQVTFTETTTTIQATVVSSSTIITSITSVTVVPSASTSTVSVTTVSITAVGTTKTSITFSTSSVSVTQTESNLATLISSVTTNETTVTTALQNPPLELVVAGIILFSVLMIAINLMRRSGHRGPVVCSRCGFNNPSARKWCTNCGAALKKA